MFACKHFAGICVWFESIISYCCVNYVRSFYSCVRKLSKQTLSTSKTAPDVALLAQWNCCVDALVSITDVTKNANGADLPPSRAFFDLLPSLMRTGRVFLEGLLRGAMSFLNALFRYVVLFLF